jgi:hypothetical protein
MLIADRVKLLADEEQVASKMIILGINEVGKSLINFAPDLVNRIDIIRFENSPDEKVLELVEKGEAELNILIDTKKEIVREANGGFYIAQMICSEICQRENLLETSPQLRTLSTSFEGIKSAIWKRLSDKFYGLQVVRFRSPLQTGKACSLSALVKLVGRVWCVGTESI